MADGMPLIAIGWGDRDFYLNTPEWKDLTLERALGALSGGNPALLHVTYIPAAALPAQTYRLPLSAAQYAALMGYVLDTVPLRGGAAIALPGTGYGYNDAFFQARGAYSPFNTCNSWVGRGLLRAGIIVSRWTPFAPNVYWHLQRR